MNDDNDINLYRYHVNRLARERSDELISNGKPAHAGVLIKGLLSHADKEIRILSSTLRGDIYETPEVLNALDNFLSRPESQLKILIQDYDKLSTKNKFFKKSCGFDNSRIKRISDRDRTIKEHFTIMDGDGYRFCPDTEKPNAVACFNRPVVATNLKKQFDILFDRSIALPS